MKISKGIMRSMGIYTVSNVINAGIPFLLLPVLTNYLSTADYGVLSNFNALANLMIPLVGINLMSSVQVQFIKEEVVFRDYVSSGLRFSMILAIFFSLIAVFAGNMMSKETGVPAELLYLMGAYGLFNTVIEVLLAIWRMEDKAINYGIFRISRTILEVALVLIFVIGLRLDFYGSVYGMLISYGLATAAGCVILWNKKMLFGTFSADYLGHAITYGVPLIPHTVSSVVIMYADKLILTHYHGLSANGIYSVGFMVGQVIGLLQNSFNQAWVPWVFQTLKAGRQEDKLKMVQITYLYILGILLTVVVLWITVPFIYTFLGKDFQVGMNMVLYIALGFAFNGMYKMVSVYIFYLEKTWIIALITLGVAILNVTLSVLLIPHYGAGGAAYSQMISMLILFLLTWLISSRLIKMPWNLKL